MCSHFPARLNKPVDSQRTPRLNPTPKKKILDLPDFLDVIPSQTGTRKKRA